jgi:tRNA1(Val) A37 N6-methylase TrmN6
MAKLKKMTARRQKLHDELMQASKQNMIDSLSDEKILEIPCDIYHNCLTAEENEIIVDRVFKYYRSVGFPYYDMSDEDILKEYKKFMAYKMTDLVVEDDEINQIMHGLNLTNNFFPNMWEVQCKEMLTPKQVFDDDVLFKKALAKRIKMSDCPLRPFGIRKAIKIFSGTQSVSGFRPSVAKCLVETLFPNRKTVGVLDPCMGWGGRLFGCVTSPVVDRYVGFDVATETVEGLRCLKDKLFDLKLISDTDVDIIEGAFEESRFQLNMHDKFDLVLTSPPYFDIEKYSDDPEQSFLKFKTYEEWVEGFLKPSIELSHGALKNNGYIAFNVGYGELYDDTYRIIEEVFGKVDKVYKMRLSRMCGRGIDKDKVKFKYEPIIVARKR